MSQKTLKDFNVNERVQTHPATDLWMSGDRYGTVVKIGRKYVHVKLDRSGRTQTIAPSNLIDVNE